MAMPAAHPNRGRTIDNAEVLRTARQMLSTVGVHEFSVRELAKEMGLVPGTIYARFGTKDELVAQLFIGRLEEMVATIDALDASRMASVEAFVALVAPEIGGIRHEYERHFVRDREGRGGIDERTWEEVRRCYRMLSARLHRVLTEVAANLGVEVIQGTLAQRYVWSVLASVPVISSARTYGHQNSSYSRFAAQALLRTLSKPAAEPAR